MNHRLCIGVYAAVEGVTDEAVLRKLAALTGLGLVAVYGRNGKADLLRRLPGYNRAAHGWPWIVLVDLDKDADCAPPALREWLPHPAAGMHLRVAVRSVETWLMGDREGFADFLGIPVRLVPEDPESLTNPKEFLLQLAGQSRKRALRADLLPRPGSGRTIGPGYASRVIDYAHRVWRPEAAASRSESLRRCLASMKRIVTEGGST